MTKENIFVLADLVVECLRKSRDFVLIDPAILKFSTEFAENLGFRDTRITANKLLMDRVFLTTKFIEVLELGEELTLQYNGKRYDLTKKALLAGVKKYLHENSLKELGPKFSAEVAEQIVKYALKIK